MKQILIYLFFAGRAYASFNGGVDSFVVLNQMIDRYRFELGELTQKVEEKREVTEALVAWARRLRDNGVIDIKDDDFEQQESAIKIKTIREAVLQRIMNLRSEIEVMGNQDELADYDAKILRLKSELESLNAKLQNKVSRENDEVIRLNKLREDQLVERDNLSQRLSQLKITESNLLSAKIEADRKINDLRDFDPSQVAKRLRVVWLKPFKSFKLVDKSGRFLSFLNSFRYELSNFAQASEFQVSERAGDSFAAKHEGLFLSIASDNTIILGDSWSWLEVKSTYLFATNKSAFLQGNLK